MTTNFLIQPFRKKHLWRSATFLFISIISFIFFLISYSWDYLATTLLEGAKWFTVWIDVPAWFGVFLFFLLFAFLLRLWWVKFWHHYEILTEFIYAALTIKLAHFGLSKELIYLVKFYQSFHKSSLRLFKSRIHFESKNDIDSKTYTYFSHSFWRNSFHNTRVLLFNFVTIISILITICVTWNITPSLLRTISLNYIFDLNLNEIWSHFSKTPAFLAVSGIIFIFLYLNGTKGFIKRAIASANRKKLEEVVNEHREIIFDIGISLNDAFDNLDYVILNRRGIARALVKKIYDDNEDMNTIVNSIDTNSTQDYEYYSEELIEIEKLHNLQTKITSKRAFYYGSMSYFLRLSSLLEGFSLLTSSIKSNQLELYFFTPRGLEILLKEKPPNLINTKSIRNLSDHEKIELLQKNELFMYNQILEAVVNGIEVQNALFRYVRTASQSIYMGSDFLGRNFRSLFNKDSW